MTEESKARGEGQGAGGEPQGDGGADVCVCPECGAEAPHEKGAPCAEQECPECGAAMVGQDEKSAGRTSHAKAVTKKEGDGEHPASHYLVVEDPQKPSTWHLRVRNVQGEPDHRLMGAAWAALHGGYRGNVYQGPNKSEAIAKLKKLYASEGMDTPSKSIVGVKAVDEETLTLAGYGVIWGGKDLEGEYFTPQTDFWFDRISERPMTLYQHGQDKGPKKSVIGRVANKVADDMGLWIEAQIDRANQYAEAIEELTEKGILGWSSGAVGHLVDRDKDGRILSWPVVEFSLTPTPAEPRTLGVSALRSLAETEPAVKTLLPQEDVIETPSASVANGKADAAQSITENVKTTEETTMSEDVAVKEVAQPFDTGALADTIVKGITSSMADAMIEAMKAYHEMQQPAAKGGVLTVQDALDELEGTKSFGDWLLSVQRADRERLTKVYNSTKDLVEGTGTAGGYLVPEEYLAEMVSVADPFQEVVYPRARRIPGMRRSIRIPVLDQTSAPAASYKIEYYGGVYAHWTEEAGAKTEVEPSFKQLELVAHKLAGFTQASDELMADSAVGIDALLRQLFAGAVRFRRDYAYLRGTGIGQPLGILNSGALLTTPRDVANQISANDIHSLMQIFLPTSMGGPNTAWVISQTCMEFIFALGDGTNWLFADDMHNKPSLMLYGIPIIWTEKLPALGTQGDILLADFSYYYIYDRTGLAIDVSQHYAFVNDLTTWRFVFRTDGQPSLSDPLYIDATNQVSPFVALAATTD